MNSQPLIIIGCSQRKKKTSRLIAALDRYDGPMFQVLRKKTEKDSELRRATYVLSGKFGLIHSDFPTPRYDRRLSGASDSNLTFAVDTQLKQAIDAIRPDAVFVSVGKVYWQLLEEPLSREVAAESLFVASGSIGGRASQLVNWLGSSNLENKSETPREPSGEATLLGTTIKLTRPELIRKAKEALLHDSNGATRFETWFVQVGRDRVAAKWLVSVLFDKPVARFRTADARRILHQLGIETRYAG